MDYTPRYIGLYQSGRLKEIANLLEDKLSSCRLCPHKCGTNRHKGEKGICRSGILPVVSSYGPHFGEEPPLVGFGGSGTIFFTNCNMACIFCQNYDISHLGYGKEVTFEELADMMIYLQRRGCHNINFVTPTHMIYPIIKSLEIAIPRGLNIPLVYNSGGYDSSETLRLLEGVFDIYMPDFKYADGEVARRLSGVKNYPEVAKEAVSEMYAQVGDLFIDSRGIAKYGLMVRHLVLPENMAGSFEVVEFLSGISKNLYLNIMDQYRPVYEAYREPAIARRTRLEEVMEVVNHAKKLGMKRVIY